MWIFGLVLSLHTVETTWGVLATIPRLPPFWGRLVLESHYGLQGGTVANPTVVALYIENGLGGTMAHWCITHERNKGCHPSPTPQFFWTSFKRGGGHFHVQKFWSKFCMILKAFWQHKIDIKRLFKGRNVKILGWICHSFHRFTHYFVKLCRDRRLRAF